ncbi:MAG TPA: vWA domain-containing protein [Polyangiaceae bacterium]
MRTLARVVFPVSLAAGVCLALACGSSQSDSGFQGSSSSGSSGGGSGGNGDASGSGSGGSSGGSGGGSSGSFGDGGVVEGGALGDAGCATATAKATKSPVYMLFVVDGSGSMSQNNKWTSATTALKAIFADMNKQADPGIGVGMLVFSDSNDPTGGNGPYPQSVDVPINFVGAAQLSALDNRLSGSPFDGTPTGSALSGGYMELENFMAMTPLPPGGQKVLVLLTDGVPTDNCAQNGGSYTSNQCVVEAATELTKAKPQGPILTYVIGTGVFPSTDLTNFDPNFLGNLALAGGSGPKNCNPNENTTSTDLCYFEVDPTTGNAAQTEMAFENAINAIRGQVLSCTFPLNVNSDAGMIDPSKVNVTVDGMTVSQDPVNGWTYDNPTNPTEIIFHGTSCNNLKNPPDGGAETVNIILGCATVVGPNM